MTRQKEMEIISLFFFQNKSNSWLFFKKKKILLHFLLSRGK